MDWLNYHHLLYFWLAVREGGVSGAARRLRLAHPTVSAQIRALEDSLGQPLFERMGRRIVPTEFGRTVYGYADEIFSLGQELLDTVRRGEAGRAPRLTVGAMQSMPKLLIRTLLEPALALPEHVRLEVHEDRLDRLLTELALHRIDAVLTDAPLVAGSSFRAYQHLLGETGITFFAAGGRVRTLRSGFPASLHGEAMLLPAPESALRSSLDAWFERVGIRPRVRGEFDDSALLKAFGEHGHGVFPGPTAIEAAVRGRHGAQVVGRVEDVRVRYYLLSTERRLQHPAVLAITNAARRGLAVAGDADGSTGTKKARSGTRSGPVRAKKRKV